MRKQAFTIMNGNGPEERQGYIVGSFGIDNRTGSSSTPWWKVTHLLSGYLICHSEGFDTRTEAITYATKAEALTDWSLVSRDAPPPREIVTPLRELNYRVKHNDWEDWS